MPIDSEILFTRETTRKGLFTWPTTVFKMTRKAGGAEIGSLIIQFDKAEYVSAHPGSDFRIKRNFWGMAWHHEGDAQARFVRINIGFKHTATFADGTRYLMRVKRRWRPFSKKAAEEATHRAAFYRDDTEVMTLENFRDLPMFRGELSGAMEGVIRTSLSDERTVAGLLLLFQTYLLHARNSSVASS